MSLPHREMPEKTPYSWGVPNIRPVFAALISSVLVLSLSACEKPNPGASVVSGTSVAHSEALCWSEDEAITPKSCAQDIVTNAKADPSIGTIEVLADQTIGISVDPKVAELGWYVAIGGQRFNEDAITETYYRFTFPNVTVPAEGYDLQIIAQGKGNATRGIWVFKLIGK